MVTRFHYTLACSKREIKVRSECLCWKAGTDCIGVQHGRGCSQCSEWVISQIGSEAHSYWRGDLEGGAGRDTYSWGRDRRDGVGLSSCTEGSGSTSRGAGLGGLVRRGSI
jgi:hypothetical protein